MQKHFFLLPSELRQRLLEVESVIPLCYVNGWLDDKPHLKEHQSCIDLPLLGESTNGRHMTAGWYFVFKGEPKFEVVTVERESGLKYKIDLSTVDCCIDLICPAFHPPTNTLRRGEIRAFKGNATSKRFLKKFAKLFLRGCDRNEFGDRIGPECLTKGITLKQ